VKHRKQTYSVYSANVKSEEYEVAKKISPSTSRDTEENVFFSPSNVPFVNDRVQSNLLCL